MKFNLNLDSINYIKIVYKTREETTHYAKAGIKWMGEREILACARIEEGVFINTPQDVLVSFVCENGLYRTTTKLKYVNNKEPYVYFALETPEGMDFQQKREYFRVRMDDSVLLNVNRKIFPCKIYDISASGVKLELSDEIEGAIGDVIVDLLFSPKSVKAKGCFIRKDREEDFFRYSFRFIDLSQNDMDIISQKCIQKQLEYKRKALKN